MLNLAYVCKSSGGCETGEVLSSYVLCLLYVDYTAVYQLWEVSVIIIDHNTKLNKYNHHNK